jgi:phosphatidylserine/phosphatidylglycerophosphate/cardiolipin synthase-like enzyme
MLADAQKWFLQWSTTTYGLTKKEGRPWGDGTAMANRETASTPQRPWDENCTVVPLIGGYETMCSIRETFRAAIADAASQAKQTPPVPAGKRGHVYIAGWRVNPARDLSDANHWKTSPWGPTDTAAEDATALGLILKLMQAGVNVRMLVWLPVRILEGVLWFRGIAEHVVDHRYLADVVASEATRLGAPDRGVVGLDARVAGDPTSAAHHQKMIVVRVGNVNVAYCGGVDLAFTRRDAPDLSRTPLPAYSYNAANILDPSKPAPQFLDGDWQSGSAIPQLFDDRADATHRWPKQPTPMNYDALKDISSRPPRLPSDLPPSPPDHPENVYGSTNQIWHDQHLQLTGPIVATLEEQFRERWVDDGEPFEDTGGGSLNLRGDQVIFGSNPSWTPRSLLAQAVYAAGFLYDPGQDIIYSRMYPPQRSFGYAWGYDWAALFAMNTIIDCEPIFFDYAGKHWMIMLWKAQYGLETGCEIGVYNRTIDSSSPLYSLLDATIGHRPNDSNPSHNLFFDCASDSELLLMSTTLYHNGQKVFSLGPEKHWWLFGAKWGVMSKPEDLTMDVSIECLDGVMTAALVGALTTDMGYQNVQTTGNTVTFKYDKPKTPQPRDDAPSSAVVPAVRAIQQQIVSAYNSLGLTSNDPNTVGAQARAVIGQSFAIYSEAFFHDAIGRLAKLLGVVLTKGIGALVPGGPIAPLPPAAPIAGGTGPSYCQMWRTIPLRPLHGPPLAKRGRRKSPFLRGEFTIMAGLSNAIGKASQLIWIFDQYFFSVPLARLLNAAVKGTIPQPPPPNPSSSVHVIVVLPPYADANQLEEHHARKLALNALTDGLPSFWTVATKSAPTGGSFTILAANPTTAASGTATIPYNATAAQLQAQLATALGVAASGVSCTGGPLPTPITCTFTGPLAGIDVTLALGSKSLTGGSSPDATVAIGFNQLAVYNTWHKTKNLGIYVHAKTKMFDESLLVCGSANLNRRSLTCDTELDCAVLDPAVLDVHQQRLWKVLFPSSPWPAIDRTKSDWGKTFFQAFKLAAAASDSFLIDDPWKSEVAQVTKKTLTLFDSLFHPGTHVRAQVAVTPPTVPTSTPTARHQSYGADYLGQARTVCGNPTLEPDEVDFSGNGPNGLIESEVDPFALDPKIEQTTPVGSKDPGPAGRLDEIVYLLEGVPGADNTFPYRKPPP